MDLKDNNMINKVLAFLLLIATPSLALASYPELFGASYTTSAIGNQFNGDQNDPSNNYYAPAVLGFTNKFNVYLGATSTAVYFEKINNIVVKNTSTSGVTEYGNVDVNYPKFYGNALHLSIPVGGQEHLGTIALSAFFPIGDIIKASSGHPYLPEYVMYRSRHQRTSLYLNFAKSLSDSWAVSLGTILGFQASALVKTNMSLNGTSYPSWVTAQAEVEPSLGVIASVVKRFEKAQAYLTYQQEMKSNLKAQLNGEISNPTAALFDSTMDQMLSYDPHTIRVGANKSFEKTEVFGALEYQIWSQYKTPKMHIIQNSGVVLSSKEFEKLSLRDTINPRLGVRYNWNKHFSTMIGAQYRMTPFKGDFNGKGNSVDVDSLIGAIGGEYRFTLFSKDVQLGGSFQYHKLASKHVTKTPGMENDQAGDKIGAPGYDIGGHIIAGSVGLKFNF